MIPRLHDTRVCGLGEGPLWHPGRGQLFWFDILAGRLLSQDEGGAPLSWDMGEPASAAAWIDDETLMVVTASGFRRLDLATGALETLALLEADDPGTRSNDGRADPVGGFWVGTMGLGAEAGRGAIYRYFRGEVRKLYEGITIPNAICFAPDGDFAFFTDTAEGVIWRQRIDRAGWPSGEAEPLIDFSGYGLAPDGAVCDAEANLWIAQWGAWRVACHGPDGLFREALALSSAHTTCPAFGGSDLRTMYVTSATQGLPDGALDHQPGGGMTWAAEGMPVAGQPEHRFVT